MRWKEKKKLIKIKKMNRVHHRLHGFSQINRLSR